MGIKLNHNKLKFQTLLEEVDKYMLGKKPTPNIVTHYCSIESGLSIIESRNLWMTHHAHMNDPSEINYGIEIIKNSLSTISKIDYLIDFFNKLYPKHYNSLIACFMDKCDDLLGWRLYGDNGKGIAINFRTDLIPPRPPASNFLSLSVLYNYKDQLDLVNLALNHYRKNFIDQDSNIQLNASLIVLFAYILPLLKNPDYQIENEWRVFSPHLFCPDQNQEAFKSLPTHQLVEGRSKPTYSSLPFSYDAIDSVHTGPCCNLLLTSEKIKKILIRNQMDKDVLTIIPSIKSYRA